MFFGEVTPSEEVQSDPKVPVLTKMPSHNKKELQSFLGIMNYLGQFFLPATEVCEPLWKLTSAKYKWTWKSRYKSLNDKAKKIIKKNVTMEF